MFKKKDLLLIFLSATFIVLSFPKWEWTGFIIVSLIPLFFALQKKTPKQAFWMGWILGYLVSLGAFYWVCHTLQEFGQLPLYLALPIFLIFCTFCNLHLAVFCYVYVKIPLLHLRPLWVPILFTVIEFCFPQVFHWYLGACLYKKLWLIQFAEITGVAGVTFFVVLLNVFIYELIRWIKKDFEIFPKYAFSISLALFLVAGLYSIRTLQTYQETLKRAPTIRAALIQTNVGNLDKLKGSKGYQHAAEKMQDINRTMILNAAADNPNLDLIVLPETAVPGYFTPERPGTQQFMFQLASQVQTPIYFGGYGFERTPEGNPLIYNSTFLVSPYYQVSHTYHKNNLLIFGEYMPLSTWIPKLKDWFPTVGDFAWGKTQPVFTLTKDRRFAPLICFEGLFGSYVRRFVQKGANFLVIVTNDSWFGDTANPDQHLMLHVWRAIENRTPILRVANTGISAFIDLSGKIQSKTKLFEPSILVDNIAVIDHQTFYAKFGNLFMGILILLFVGFVLYSFVSPRHLRHLKDNEM